ncbi:placenta growth factor isoform A [Alligator mississippiensis]|uniref:Placenta growth factor isoform A n=1 Tax=Alligator mississippiensis TaxID=8496 RepID=A0A151MLK5_ALLMI|nr:placenta growth factor isoform A [Alligator mississippiensis]
MMCTAAASQSPGPFNYMEVRSCFTDSPRLTGPGVCSQIEEAKYWSLSPWRRAPGDSSLSCLLSGHIFPELCTSQKWTAPFFCWLDGSLGNSTSDGAVLPFQEVWGRSFCRPLEKLVDIVTEYPSEVEHLFSPSCVSLRRCTGCCGDERLQCVPVEMANVTMQLLRMKPEGQVPYVELSFIEHRQCACRPRRDTLKSGRRRRKGRGTRLITLTGLWRLSY